VPPGVRELVAERLGLEFRARRSEDLERGLARAARADGFRTVGEYVRVLRALPASSTDWQRLAGELTIGESYFFRDRATHDALRRHVIPELIAERRRVGVLRLRLWSAGCSTGEEAYSLAILVHRLLPDRERWHVTILGTDVDPRALEAARRGIYRPWSMRDIPDWIRPHFISRGPDRFELAPEIRRMVTLAPLNLVSDAYPASVTGTCAMDVILCRNVLMFFTREAQRATVERLKRSLVGGGWLVLSPAEASPDLLRPLAPVYFPGAVLRRKEATSAPRAAVRPEPPSATPETRAAAPRRSPARSPTPVERARAEADGGRLDRAIELCNAALEQDRLDPEAYLLLAAIHRERGDVATALHAARAAIYAAPDSAAAHFLLGTVLLQDGAVEQGRRSMETVADLLDAVPPDQPVAAGEGMTAEVLLATARAHLALAS
jgi:chemotaxis protein methyltransferase CheR